MKVPVLAEVLKDRGAQSRLARHLGILPEAVMQWREVPIKRVAAVEQYTGIPRHKLRPDLYPEERESVVGQASQASAP